MIAAAKKTEAVSGGIKPILTAHAINGIKPGANATHLGRGFANTESIALISKPHKTPTAMRIIITLRWLYCGR